jgi:hypothetical protein
VANAGSPPAPSSNREQKLWEVGLGKMSSREVKFLHFGPFFLRILHIDTWGIIAEMDPRHDAHGLALSGDASPWSGENLVKMDGAKRHGVISCTYDAKNHGAAKKHCAVLWDLAA